MRYLEIPANLFLSSRQLGEKGNDPNPKKPETRDIFNDHTIDVWWLKTFFRSPLTWGAVASFKSLIILWSPLVHFALNIFSLRKFFGEFGALQKTCIHTSIQWKLKMEYHFLQMILRDPPCPIGIVWLSSCQGLVNTLCGVLMAKILSQIGSVSLVV